MPNTTRPQRIHTFTTAEPGWRIVFTTSDEDHPLHTEPIIGWITTTPTGTTRQRIIPAVRADNTIEAIPATDRDMTPVRILAPQEPRPTLDQLENPAASRRTTTGR